MSNVNRGVIKETAQGLIKGIISLFIHAGEVNPGKSHYLIELSLIKSTTIAKMEIAKE